MVIGINNRTNFELKEKLMAHNNNFDNSIISHYVSMYERTKANNNIRRQQINHYDIFNIIIEAYVYARDNGIEETYFEDQNIIKVFIDFILRLYIIGDGELEKRNGQVINFDSNNLSAFNTYSKWLKTIQKINVITELIYKKFKQNEVINEDKETTIPNTKDVFDINLVDDNIHISDDYD